MRWAGRQAAARVAAEELAGRTFQVGEVVEWRNKVKGL